AQPSTPTDLTATMQMVPMSTATVPPTQGILPQREPTKTPWPVPTPTGSLSPTTTPTGTPSLLQGPLIAFRVQNDSNYLLLFEPATSTLREIRGDILEYAFRLQWLDRGCRLYVRGQVIDLRGNVTEQLANNRDASELFNMSLLSPDW